LREEVRDLTTSCNGCGNISRGAVVGMMLSIVAFNMVIGSVNASNVLGIRLAMMLVKRMFSLHQLSMHVRFRLES